MSLTNRQAQTARLVRLGYTNKEIADCMGLQYGTVKVRLWEMYRELGLRNRAELAAWYVKKNTNGTP